jgi:hypothetical protein
MRTPQPKAVPNGYIAAMVGDMSAIIDKALA